MDKEILKDFVAESKQIVNSSLSLLEGIEGNYSKISELEVYGNNIDRIMGGARTVALGVGQDHVLFMISDYAALCKAVGYKASQIKNNESLFNICVGLLIDATEMLSNILDNIDKDTETLKRKLPQEFIERVRWASNQFKDDLRESVDVSKNKDRKKMNKREIDELIRKLEVKKK